MCQKIQAMENQPETLPETLVDILRRHIALNGPMDIGAYMGLCLGHPVHGYYMKRDPFGRGGDFTTAPEVSQMFGEMIGVWLADMWQRLGAPPSFVLLECGPGRGTLMQDILRATTKVPGFLDAAKLHLLETSPVLQEKQRATITRATPQWHETLETIPTDMPILMVANELYDALPVRQAVFTGQHWVERVVTLEGGNQFCFGYGQTLPAPTVSNPVIGDVYEFSPMRDTFTQSLSQKLKQRGGAALIIDYGFTHATVGDTFQAVKNHQFCSVFETPGDADLTSHVDFESIGRRARAEGIIAHGPITQGAFLQNLGIEHRLSQLTMNATADQKVNVVTGYHRLIEPHQMGDLFKVIALCHTDSIKPAGFQ